jgi:hypothetical protein
MRGGTAASPGPPATLAIASACGLQTHRHQGKRSRPSRATPESSAPFKTPEGARSRAENSKRQRLRSREPRCVIRRPRRGHVRAAARCRRPPSLTRHAAGLPCRPAAAQQGDPLPRRPTNRRGDRRRHARRRRRRARATVARADRRALARRPAHPRDARAHRGRPRRAPRIATRPPRQGRPPPRGRHGRLGLGTARAVAAGARPTACRTAVLRRHRAHARSPLGRPPPRARSCAASPARPACGDASRRTSCAARTRSRWRARACR